PPWPARAASGRLRAPGGPWPGRKCEARSSPRSLRARGPHVRAVPGRPAAPRDRDDRRVDRVELQLLRALPLASAGARGVRDREFREPQHAGAVLGLLRPRAVPGLCGLVPPRRSLAPEADPCTLP